MKYSDKLRDPRWQKMRLQVMNRAGFQCENCGDSKSTLQAHHNYYVSKRDPWEYPLGAISCLCEKCHSEITANKGCVVVEYEGTEAVKSSEWEYGALLGLRCMSALSRNEGCKLSEVISVMSNSSQIPDVEAMNILDRLVFKHADGGGLLNRLLALEQKGLL